MGFTVFVVMTRQSTRRAPYRSCKKATASVSTSPSDSEKGILHPREQARHRSLNRLAAGPEAARFVEWYWIVEWDLDEPYTAEVLPFP